MSDLKRTVLRVVFIGLLLVVAFSLQSVVGGRISLWGLHPDVMPYIVTFCALFFGKSWGAGIGCAAGILIDASSDKTVCFYTVALMLAAVVIGHLGEKYYKAKLFFGLLSGCGVYLAVNFLRLFFHFIIFGNAGLGVFFVYCIPAGLFSALFAVPYYYIVRIIDKKLD